MWELVKPYWVSPERWMARGLLAVIIGMNLGEVYLNVLFNDWNNAFYNSLQAVDIKAFTAALIRFSWLAAIFIVNGVYKMYLNQMLSIRWRRWLTGHYLHDWLGQQNYYRMQLLGQPTDNPDQRISEDINQFISYTLDLSLGLLSAGVTLFSFLTILWNLSGPLAFDVGAMHVNIPGYMVWVALVYAVFGTWLTMVIGRPLVGLSFDQQKFEADFRFGLVRLRENSESIAFYQGEAREGEAFHARFGAIFANYWQIMKRQKMLNWFTSGYQQIAIIFPYVVAAPRFFAKQIQLGGLMQTASAFGQVQGSLSYIVNSYVSLAGWRAVMTRLSGFNQSVRRAEAARVPAANFDRTHEGDKIIAENLTVKLPDGAVLLKNIHLNVARGNSLLITGPSGAGKSTLLRAIAGLWPFVEGKLVLPIDLRMLFLPQKPYLPLGTLREVLCYPDAPSANDAALVALLKTVQLDHLSDKLNAVDNWSHILSLGEQQRIAIARVLLARPDFVFLDEATSALDESTEARLYPLLKQTLPRTAIISVGHRATLRAFHDAEMTL